MKKVSNKRLISVYTKLLCTALCSIDTVCCRNDSNSHKVATVPLVVGYYAEFSGTRPLSTPLVLGCFIRSSCKMFIFLSSPCDYLIKL